MFRKSLGLISLSLLLILISQSLQQSNPFVVELTSSNFEEELYKNPGIMIVQFYAPWCGHCKRLAPQFDAAAKSLGGIVKFAKINCDVEGNLAQQFEIKGFPTIKVFEFVTPGEKPNVEDYQGPREAKSIVNFALTKFADLIDPVRKVTTDLTEGEKRKLDPYYTVALFTKKDKNPNLFKSVAIEIRKKSDFLMRKVQFLFIQEDENTRKKWISAFGINKSPAIVIIKPKTEENSEIEGRFVKYDSDNFQRPSILKFIYDNIVEQEIPKQQQSSEQPSPNFETSSAIEAKEINSLKEVQELCSAFCLIGLYSSNEQKNAFIEEAKKTGNHFKLGIINKNSLSSEHEVLLKAFNQESVKDSQELTVLGLKLKRKRFFFENIEISECKKLFDKAIDGVGLKFNAIDEETMKNLSF